MWISDTALDHLRGVIVLPDLSATKYELLGEIGRGGMGVVYKARDSELDRHVALKVLHVADPAAPEATRLEEEARILARLEHPGIVPVHDLSKLPDGRVFYAMKLVDGIRLDRFAENQPALSELLRVFTRVCESVAFAHSQGVIHRDLKPQNIMVGRFGEVLVMDWGVAKLAGRVYHAGTRVASGPQTAAGTIMGTPDYMAPEQASGATEQVDERSDVYSLGVTLRSLLSSRPDNETVPRRLMAIWRKAVAKDPSGRYQTVLELRADIERFLNHEPVGAYRETVIERLARVAAHNKTLLALVLTYLAARILLFFASR